MNPSDKNYLRTQFLLKIHEKSFTEFQRFFEDIMEKAYPDFQKIRPYGKKGDAGNDGYIPVKGEYYQVYSPKSPADKESQALRN